MENLNSLLLIVQVLLSISLIVLILLQHGKGADAGAAFGSGASASVFGSRGAGNFMSRATGIIATLFFIVCLSLAYLASNRASPDAATDSIMTQQIEAGTDMQGSGLPPAEGSSETEVDSDLPPAE